VFLPVVFWWYPEGMSDAPPLVPARTAPAPAFGWGAAVGTLGGLIGLGGAEFRLPVLVHGFGHGIRDAVRLNLLVSLITVAAALAGRLAMARFPSLGGYGVEIVAVTAGAMAAAWLGTGLMRRLSEGGLTLVVAGLLMGIAALLLGEAVLPDGTVPPLPGDAVVRAVAGVLFGLAIGLVSSLLGVAGGELIIPTFLFAFGADIKTAGTASLIVSLPTILVGVARHARAGAYRSRAVMTTLVAPMGAGSIVGAGVGAALVGWAPVALLKAALGTILAVSSVKMFRHARH